MLIIDVEKIMGLKSVEIENKLGYKHHDGVAHKENLALIGDKDYGNLF